MKSPSMGNVIEGDWIWAADNGAFASSWKAGKWVNFLESSLAAPTPLFAVVPDSIGDARETRRLWDVWSPVVREMGYRTAYVLQDGEMSPPWDELDCTFVGGSTEWKLGPAVRLHQRQALKLGKWTHMGRVNSWRRIEYAYCQGYDTVDGTFLAFGPEKNLPRLMKWVERLENDPPQCK